ncbi:MAG: histidinol dehydrogenase, partial [Acidimicrobiia bacterium]
IPSVLRRLDLRAVNENLRAALDPPVSQADPEVVDAARSVIEAVRTQGLAAVRELTQRFDGCDLADPRVPDDDLQTALDIIDPALRSALHNAADAIRAYHSRQVGQGATPFERNGLTVTDIVRPVARAGLYVPGGRASYPSTVLMTAIPAALAGVERIVLCVPPDRDGTVAPAVLAAAAIAGVHEVWRIGGAQAIAAMAYGAGYLQPVDVIVGPGNAYVAAAKREVAGMVHTESMAGPSELVVIADGTASPAWIAADLFAQAEHGPGGLAVVVSWDESVLDAIDAAISTALDTEPRRAEIESTFSTGGRSVLVRDSVQAMAVSNAVAPEHLQIAVADAIALVESVESAGAVFLGAYGTAVLGDYAVGTNHVLPTGGTARFASALRVDDFRKHIHVVEVPESAFNAIAPIVETIAAAEGLAAHERAVRDRH